MIHGILAAVMSPPPPPTDPGTHWDGVHERVGDHGGSWYQREPRVALELIHGLGMAKTTPVVDIGGGSSKLVDALLRDGFLDISVLDVSPKALELAQSRLGEAASGVHWFCEDFLAWEPSRRYGLWHDRATFHFLVEPEHRERYRSLLRSALSPDGLVIMATFAPEGPERCSGLPVVRYGPEGIVDALGEGFVCLATRREEHTTPSGTTQPFSWVALRGPS